VTRERKSGANGDTELIVNVRRGMKETAGEYLTKKANLYNEYARIPSSQITDLLIGKLTS